MAKYGRYESRADHLAAVLYWNSGGQLSWAAASNAALAAIASGWTAPALPLDTNAPTVPDIHACAKCGHAARQHPVPGHCEWWTDSTQTDPRVGGA